MSNEQEALRWIVGLLRRLEVPFQAVGGLAARAYGSRRPLVDLDFYVPTDRLEDAAAAAAGDLVRAPAPYRDDNWNLTFLQLERRGCKVELGGAEGARYFDAKAQRWRSAEIDFARSVELPILGVEVPTMPLEQLLDYKSALDREVDRQDIAQIAGPRVQPDAITPELEESIARAMEADTRLLPLLPELLADLWELGPSATDVVAVLETIGVGPGSSVLDLACGKGAVAVALAEQLGVRVEGVDAFPPFVDAARGLALERGVGDLCRFRQGDIRERLGGTESHDVVTLLSVGPLMGDYERTIAGLRSLVRPGGYIVFEDGFLADGVTVGPGTEAYTRHADVLDGLTACGDVLVHEHVCSAPALRSTNRRNTDLIRERARRLVARFPDLGPVVDPYVRRQEHETRTLGSDVLCAVWALRRA